MEWCNDHGVQNMSGLGDYLLRLFQESPGEFEIGRFHLLPALYSDGMFALLPCIIPRYTGHKLTDYERRVNKRMAVQRIALERLFAEHHNNFQIFQCIDLLRKAGSRRSWR